MTWSLPLLCKLFYKMTPKIFQDGLTMQRDKLLTTNLERSGKDNLIVTVYLCVFHLGMITFEQGTSLTLFITSTSDACVQKLSCTEVKVRPCFWQYSAVNIIWHESSEWMKLGGNPPFCFTRFGNISRAGTRILMSCSGVLTSRFIILW